MFGRKKKYKHQKTLVIGRTPEEANKLAKLISGSEVNAHMVIKGEDELRCNMDGYRFKRVFIREECSQWAKSMAQHFISTEENGFVCVVRGGEK